MEFWTILLVIYAAMTAAALFMTVREQRNKKVKAPIRLVVGYLLCAVWPAVVAVMVIFYRPGTQNPGAQES